MNKLKVGVLGATGMVGQRFVSLLDTHPWFEVVCLAASPKSAGKTYVQAIGGKWKIAKILSDRVKSIKVAAVEEDADKIAGSADFVFSALDLDKEKIKLIEELYAGKGCSVVSNNSAHRWTKDVPMIIPEINPDHTDLIKAQREKRNWDKGFIVVKPNCSIQSYVPVLKALWEFGPKKVVVTALQAISGAGKTFESWPEMNENIIPLIDGEEAKSEKEPMKILGKLENGQIIEPKLPLITATCIRVPVIDGHMTSVDLELERTISKEKFIDALVNYKNPIAEFNLPSAPKQFMKYFEENDRPQTRIDRNYENGMGITVGRLRQDSVLGWKFVSLSHNTVRGAAGGAILLAELLKAKGYL
jgi:aspartate-semialdehyde dehydrogenase